MGTNAVVADTVGHVTFTRASRLAGQDGSPIACFHSPQRTGADFHLNRPAFKDGGKQWVQAPNVMVGCHYLVGTSGTLKKEERRAVELAYAIETRANVLALGL